jgi:hypothetical protein
MQEASATGMTTRSRVAHDGPGLGVCSPAGWVRPPTGSPDRVRTTSHKLSSGKATSVSTLWTPGGEHVPDSEPAAELPPDEDLDEEALTEELRRVRAEIASTPAVDIVANHAVGLWQLAVLHLTPDEGQQPRLDEAAIAIDAMGGIVDALGDRLGDHAGPLRDAVSQLRMAFVEVQQRSAGD